MEPLTPKQQQVLEFVASQLGEDRPPSQREIAHHFGLAQNAAYQLVRYLRRKGYLVDAGARMLGTDLAGVELPPSDPRLAEQYNHHQLLDKDICLIEHVGHLNRLSRSRFIVFALTIPIAGLDSFPIRIVALEER